MPRRPARHRSKPPLSEAKLAEAIRRGGLKGAQAMKDKPKESYSLAANHDKFAMRIAKGYSNRAAFIDVYEPKDSVPMKQIDEMASRIRNNVRVKLRIDEIREPAAHEAKVTLKGHLRSMARLRDKAEDMDQIGVAVTAESHIGKAAGLYVEKHQHEGKFTLEQLVTGKVPKESDE